MKALVLLILLLPTVCFAHDKKIQVLWEYTTEITEGGFKIFQYKDTVPTLVATIPDIDLREWEGNVDLVVGENQFVMTAYDTENESVYSAAYPLEFALNFNKPILHSITTR